MIWDNSDGIVKLMNIKINHQINTLISHHLASFYCTCVNPCLLFVCLFCYLVRCKHGMIQCLNCVVQECLYFANKVILLLLNAMSCGVDLLRLLL